MLFIAGASGFIGGHLVDYFLSRGHKLKCLARSEKAVKQLSSKGIEVIQGDITMPSTLNGVLDPDDFVIHLVGIIEEKGSSTFQSVHVQGTYNLIQEAKRAGVRHFFYQSALGSDRNSWSRYLKTKAEAEDIAKQSGLSYTIFRPSLIIGPWDGFTSKLVEIIKLSPVIPMPGEGKFKMQPLFINDWLRCIEKVIESPNKYMSTYDIGGPEHLSYREIVEKLVKALGSAKPIIHVPAGIVKFSVGLFESFKVKMPVTSDQLRLLEQDNICDLNSVHKNFGFIPESYENALKEFVLKYPIENRFTL